MADFLKQSTSQQILLEPVSEVDTVTYVILSKTLWVISWYHRMCNTTDEVVQKLRL
jgi:hypothetical protein